LDLLSVSTTPEQIRAATVPVSPNNPLADVATPVQGNPYFYKIAK
jgi:hypothetical protein